jgi:hypothetical protein
MRNAITRLFRHHYKIDIQWPTEDDGNEYLRRNNEYWKEGRSPLRRELM